MARQIPHAEDLATGVATAGLVPVSTGVGSPPAWGAASGALANVAGWRDQFNQAGAPANSGAPGDTSGFKAFQDPVTLILRYIPTVMLGLMRNAGAVYEGPDWTRHGRVVILASAAGAGDTLSAAYLYDPTQPPPVATTALASYVPTGVDRHVLGYALNIETSGNCQKCLGANAAPAGWETVGFNDSTWQAPVGSNTGAVFPIAPAIWHSGDNLDRLDTFFRHSWTGKAPATQVQLQTSSCAITNVYFNGVLIYTGPTDNAVPWTVDIPGTIDQSGTNVLAIHASGVYWVHSAIMYRLLGTDNPHPTDWADPLLDDSGWAVVLQGRDAGGGVGSALVGTTAITSNDGNVGYDYQWLIRHHMTIPAGTISSARLTLYTKSFVMDAQIDGVSVGHWTLADGASSNLNMHTIDVTARLQTLLGSDGGDFVLALYLKSPDNAGGRIDTYTYTSYQLVIY